MTTNSSPDLWLGLGAPSSGRMLVAERTVECLFCDEEESAVDVLETRHFRVKPDISPLVEGHVLIYSKSHIGCAGEIEPRRVPEFLEVKQFVAEMIRARYGRVAFYEHGRAGHCLSHGEGEAECHHFHMHALPLSVSIREELSARYRVRSMGGAGDLPAAFERHGSYLYFEGDDGELSFAPVPETIEPHLLRTLIATRLGTPEKANWEEHQDPIAQAVAREIFVRYVRSRAAATRP